MINKIDGNNYNFLNKVEYLNQAIALPSNYNWEGLSLAWGIYALFSLGFGWRSHFLVWKPQPTRTILKIVATSLIAPAILEELFFRGILLPDPSSHVGMQTYVARSLLSLSLFVVYHPLNALTFFPQAKQTFFDPVFLTLATALGIVCTFSYWQTSSLWLPIAIHWLTVVLWLSYFDGWDKLYLNSVTKESDDGVTG